MSVQASDLPWMERALALAQGGRWGTSPNPRVGCVIVYQNAVIAEGWHAAVGGPHAEVAALDQLDGADPRLSHATAYVSLEPCNHHGLTPPCTERLISSGVHRVVIGMVDPDARVSGSGIERLKKAGLTADVMETLPEGRWLNRRFLSSIERQRPWVVLKCAVSADGYADPVRDAGQKGSLAITSPLLRRLTHQWRAEEQAIVVGAGTVVMDDPRLDVRDATGPSPQPVVIDPQGRTSPKATVYRHPQALVFGGPEGLPGHVERIETAGQDAVPAVLRHLHSRDCRSLLVEGGPATLSHFLHAGMWDEARWCCSSNATGGGLRAPEFPSGKAALLRGEHPFGPDTIKYALHRRSADWIGSAPPPTLALPLPS